MPDVSALYPQPPAAPQQQNSMLSNPGQAVGLMGALQDYAIKSQQAGALAQIPAANLESINQQIIRQKLDTQNEIQRHIARVLPSFIPPNATKDQVLGGVAEFSRQYPIIGSQYPESVNAAGKFIMSPANGGVNVAKSRLSASGMSSEVQNVPTEIGVTPEGQTIKAPLPQFGEQSAGHGGVVSQPGMTAKASADLMATDRAHAADYQQESLALTKVIPLLKKLGPAGTGIGSDLKKQLDRVGVQFGADDSDAVIRDQVQKYLLMNASLGDDRSDAAMHHRLGINPNEQLTQGANLKLAEEALAQKRIKLNQIQEADNPSGPSTHNPTGRPIGATEYSGWAGRFNTAQDPRAYKMDIVSPEERKAVLDEIQKQRTSKSPQERAKAQRFLDSYRSARSHPGVIDTTAFGGQ